KVVVRDENSGGAQRLEPGGGAGHHGDRARWDGHGSVHHGPPQRHVRQRAERVEKGSRVVAAGLAVEGFEEDSGAKRTRICGDETATPRPGAFGGAQRRAQRDTERSAAMRAQPYAAARTFHVTLAFSQRPAGARPPLRFVLLAG